MVYSLPVIPLTPVKPLGLVTFRPKVEKREIIAKSEETSEKSRNPGKSPMVVNLSEQSFPLFYAQNGVIPEQKVLKTPYKPHRW